MKKREKLKIPADYEKVVSALLKVKPEPKKKPKPKSR